MSIYLNAALMLAATLGGIVVLARVLQALRSGSGLSLRPRLTSPQNTARRLAIEEACAVDAKRRLLLVRCGEQRVLLLTGGPADLVLTVMPLAPEAAP
jgi:hypothetical protein